jgi:hypothetical protein
MGIELSGAGLRTERLHRPFVVGFVVAENVRVTVIGSNAKICIVGTVPLILEGFDEENAAAEPELDRALIGLVAGITFDLDFHVTYKRIICRQPGLLDHTRRLLARVRQFWQQAERSDTGILFALDLARVIENLVLSMTPVRP